MIENEETWKDVVGYEQSHAVSNIGRVKLKDRTFIRKCGKICNIKEKILKPHLEKNGYYRLSLRFMGTRRIFTVHRLVCEAFHGPAPVGRPWINHINTIRQDNNSSNLHWCSPMENIHHSIQLGTINVVGINNPAAKLTEDQVLEICDLLDNSKLTQKQIAKKYNTVQSVVSAIKVGSHWNSITGRKKIC